MFNVNKYQDMERKVGNHLAYFPYLKKQAYKITLMSACFLNNFRMPAGDEQL
jgi:predicted Zn-dependent protease